ncbi:hypothetical protein AERO9A_360039 [Aeromonas salmonicida]|nr:hypothetical protein AERO9A_360039 [Aeromonas salmonicida]
MASLISTFPHLCVLISVDTDCRLHCFALSYFGHLNIYMFLWLVLIGMPHHHEARRRTAAEQR